MGECGEETGDSLSVRGTLLTWYKVEVILDPLYNFFNTWYDCRSGKYGRYLV